MCAGWGERGLHGGDSAPFVSKWERAMLDFFYQGKIVKTFFKVSVLSAGLGRRSWKVSLNPSPDSRPRFQDSGKGCLKSPKIKL